MFCFMEANLKQLPHENGRCRYKYIYIFFYYILNSSVFHEDFGIFIQHVQFIFHHCLTTKNVNKHRKNVAMKQTRTVNYLHPNLHPGWIHPTN